MEISMRVIRQVADPASVLLPRLVILILLILPACRQADQEGLGFPGPIADQPVTIHVDTQKRYAINPYTKDSVRIVVNAMGDTVLTGRQYKISGKANGKGTTEYPRITPAGNPIVLPAYTNTKSLRGKIKVIPVEEKKLTQPTATDTHGFVFTSTIGDTIQSGIPLPVIEKKIRCLFPPIANTPPMRNRYDAIYTITYLDVDHGLLYPNVSSMLFDKNENLWIGMFGGGFTRYDGTTIMPITHHAGLSNNYVNDLYEDTSGNIWTGSEGGLSRFDGVNFTHFTLQNGLPGLLVKCVTEDRNGNIWFGIQESGVTCYTPPTNDKTGTFTHYTIREGLAEMFITAILQDSKGNFWFGSNSKGVTKFEPIQNQLPGKVTYLTQEDGLPGNMILDIFEDKAGNIWFGTDKGACRFEQPAMTDLGTLTQYKFGDRVSEYPVQEIFQDNHGNIWLGTLGNGAIQLNKDGLANNHDGTYFHFTQREGLPNNRITSILQDKQGNIWLGTLGGGIGCIKSNPIIHFGKQEGFTEFSIAGMYEDEAKNIWFATRGDGLIMYRPSKENKPASVSHFTTQQGLPENQITSIDGDQSGNIWMGTSQSGICRYDGHSFMTYSMSSGLIANGITSIRLDHAENVWIGTLQGVSFLAKQYTTGKEKPVFMNYTEEERLLENRINTIYEDSRKNIWIASTRGISRLQLLPDLRSGNVLHFTEREGLPFWNVLTVMEDKNGTMWFGTGRGLIRYDGTYNSLPEMFTQYAPHGIQMKGINHTMRSVMQDHHGNVWYGSEGGINLIRKEADTTLPTRFIQFTKEDGLKGNTFLANSVLFDSHHRAWWGNSFGGVEVMDLDQFEILSEIPQLSLKALEINERFVDFRSLADSMHRGIEFDSVVPFENYPSGLKLAYNQNTVTIHFAAIDWTAPHKIKYSFQLKGLNQNWSLPSSETKAEFRSLPYGHYTFEVKAYGESQQWSPSLSYPFIIRPPWWHSWWAYVIYSLAGGAVIYSLYRFQLNRKLESAEKQRLVELDKVKNRLYSNIAHEFRTPLTLIHGPVSQALTAKAALNQKDIQSIYKQSERLQQLINQMLDLQKLEAGKLKPSYELGEIMHVLRYLFNSFEIWAREKKIKLDLSTSPAAFDMDFDQEKLTQIISNLVSNAIKHTPRHGKVSMTVNVSQSGEQLLIQVEDTGVGIREEDLPFIFERFYQSKRAAAGGSGIGLALTKNLVELLGGHISVDSKVDEGSTFRVSLPVTRQALKTTRDTTNSESFITESIDEDNQFTEPGQDSQGNPIILVVEDHPEIAKYIASCLEPGYTTLIATDGNEGLRLAYERIPDLIISDVMMPGKDGFELTGQLKTDIQTSHIPIILLTGRGDHDAFMTGLEHGADAYVTKPFDPPELLLRVKKLLELRANLSYYYRSQSTPVDAQTNNRISAKENEFLQHIRSFVEEHINDPQLNMHMLSKEMAMSHPQLHRKITALTGEPTGKFVRSVRLAKAVELLKNSDLTISEIAYETGFSEPGYFTKTFSKEYNMTPSDFRSSL